MSFFAPLLNGVRHFASRCFSIYTADDTTAAYFRAEQIRAIISLAPLTISANLINIAIVFYLFANQKSGLVYLWGFITAGLILFGLRSWFSQKRGASPSKISRRALKRAIRHSAIMGAVWGCLPLLCFSYASESQIYFVLLIEIGMICASSFALSTIPVAAFIFVLSIAIETIAALLWFQPVHFLLLSFLSTVYAFIVCAAVLVQARNFGGRLMAEASSQHQQQLTSLLLLDFETHTSDCLWELNKRGYLHNPSPKLANLFGRPLDQLMANPFLSLFGLNLQEENDEAQLAMNALAEHFAQHKAFRQMPAPLQVNGLVRWWKLTAKPLLDAQGHLLGWRGVGTDVTQERAANLEMNRLANVDSLTGLANRHQFKSRLEQEKDLLTGQTLSFALLLLDLDNFKNLNDGMGHAFGDKVLQMMAQRLKQKVRQQDLLARLGGDEFALISWGDNSIQSAEAIAHRLMECFLTSFEIDGLSLQLGCSIGIAVSPLHGNSADLLLKHADMALYSAKSAGRNTFRFYESGMAAVAQKRITTMNEIRQILESNINTKSLLTGVQPDFNWVDDALAQFQIYLQPQVRLSGAEIIGFEALIRWQHPEKGLIPPLDFIPLAEESNMIIPLGAWVLIESCKLAVSWPQPWRIAVNVSATQFSHGSLVSIVKRALAISGLEASRLELEITESLLIQDKHTAIQILKELRALGVRIALDDFGTGYSSLAYLRNFPLNQLKIDRSFVSAIVKEKGSLAIVSTIIQLANALSLETMAEGIESIKEVHLLVACGCEDGQGYHFAKPMPANQITGFVANYSSN